MAGYGRRIQTLMFALVGALLLVGVAMQTEAQSSKEDTGQESTGRPQEQTEAASGVFSVMWGDPKPGSNVKTEPGYTLTDDQGQDTELLLDEETAKASGGSLAFNGKRVEVTGTRVPEEPKKLEVQSIQFERTQDAERAAARIEAGQSAAEPVVSGSKPWATIGCRFADSTNVTPKDRAWFETEMGSTEPGLDDFWRELSYDNIDLTGSQVAVWYNLPQPRSFYLSDPQTHFQGHTLNWQKIAEDCTAAANRDVFFPSFDGINMVFNQDLDCCSWGGPRTLNLDGQNKTYATTFMATWGYGNQNVLAQEMGHGFGLPHSSGPYNTPYDSKWDPMSGGGTCSPRDATYGCLGNHTVAFHKEMMGWLPAARIYTANSASNQNITLERLGSTASGNYLMAKIPIGGSTTNFYTLEARRFVGYDGQIPGEAIVIHKVDTTRDDRQAQVVDPDNDGDPNDASAMWSPGETFNDSANGIRIRVNQATTNGYSITISPNGGTTPPANDNLASAQQLTGTTVTGTNTGATKETGEPNHAGNSGGKSVWYRWTPQTSGTVAVDTAGSDFDTLLGVYTGSAVNSLTEVASNDDADGGRQSKVSFEATAGTTYRIAADGYNNNGAGAESGSITLNLGTSVSNDNLTNARLLSGASATVTGANTGATKETGEPNHASNSGGKSVWYRWTPQTSGTVAVDTAGSDFDTLLGVYTGSAVNSLTEVASNDDADGGRQSKVSFEATAGTTYRIAADGYNNNGAGAESGSITLNLALEAATDTEDPTVSLTAPSESAVVSNSVTVSANATDNVGVTKVEFMDGLDLVIGTDTTAPYSVSWDTAAIPDGRRTTWARAYDAAGNTSATPNRLVFVNNTTPNTTITSGPSGVGNGATATFEFTSSENDSTFRCRLDNGAFSTCTSPQAYTSLSNGEHTFQVKAVGAGGETNDSDPTPASRTWTVGTPDTTPPAAPVINNPANNSYDTDGNFSVSGTAEPGSLVQIFDGTSPEEGRALASTGGNWVKTLSNESEGTHTYTAKATDAAGNTSGASNTRTVTVDKTVPTVSSVAPTADATGVALSDNITATFSEAMDSNTLTSTTFVLTKEGATSPMTATVTYDTASRKATLNPDTTLEASATYTATVKSGSGGAKDAAGNPLAADKSWSFTTAAPTDTTPPQTTIDSGPSGTINDRSASFAFSSSETGSSFRCSLDNAAFTSCASPKTYSSLTNGQHTFRVEATDRAGNPDSSPASRAWTVDTIAPDAPTIDSPEDNSFDTDGNVTVSGTAEANSTVELFDGSTSKDTTTADFNGDWATELNGAAEGEHTYTAEATDAAGNTSSASEAVTVTVDTAAPSAPLITGPPNNSFDKDGNITVSGTAEAEATVELFDGASSKGTTTADSDSNWTMQLDSVTEGSHVYRAKAIDAAGNTSSASNVRTVTVDKTAPQTTIDSGPSGTTNDRSANFAFSSSETGSSFRCSLDNAAFTSCASPKAYNSLTNGQHTFRVEATDRAGNPDSSPASRAWTVDTIAPDAPTIDSPEDSSFDTDGNVTVSGTAEANSTVELFDGSTSKDTTTADSNGDWATELNGAAEGEHTYTAEATDAADNTSSASSAVTIIIDTRAPSTTIDSGPSGTTSNRSASFTFSSSETGSSFRCSLDGAAFSDCTLPKDYSGLANGQHIFKVKATDQAGNEGSPAERTWTVGTPPPPDTTPPTGNVSINGGAKKTKSLKATLTLSATDSGSGMDQMCISNSATSCTAWQPYATSKAWTLAKGKAGTRTVYIRYKDKAGNESAVFEDTIKYAPK